MRAIAGARSLRPFGRLWTRAPHLLGAARSASAVCQSVRARVEAAAADFAGKETYEVGAWGQTVEEETERTSVHLRPAFSSIGVTSRQIAQRERSDSAPRASQSRALPPGGRPEPGHLEQDRGRRGRVHGPGRPEGQRRGIPSGGGLGAPEGCARGRRTPERARDPKWQDVKVVQRLRREFERARARPPRELRGRQRRSTRAYS